MRKTLAIVAGVTTLVLSATAVAQESEVRSKFYDFGEMLIDGEFKAPDMFDTRAREKAQFQRLLTLKKSFMPKIQQSKEERALQQ